MKRPATTRYKSKKTYAGRDVKRMTVLQRKINSFKRERSLRPMRKGR